MPNGGSDCCGTCWFNAKNKGEAGFSHLRDPEPHYCTIRQLEIRDPMYTYCGNHPYRFPNKFPVPIGPVFRANSEGYREIWQASPDTEEIRLALLDLLSGITETPSDEYPAGMYRDDIVIFQLGEFKEQRAVEHLERIIKFNPAAETGQPFQRTRSSTVRIATEALQKILEDNLLP